MKNFIKNMILGISILTTTQSQTIKSSDVAFYLGAATITGGLIWEADYLYKLYTINKTSLDNYVCQLRYQLSLAHNFLEDYESYRQGSNVDSIINERFSGYPYPAYTYVKNLKNLIKELTSLECAFEIKKSKTKNNELQTTIDEYIQVISIIKMQLGMVQQIFVYSNSYQMEKKACNWPVKTAASCLILGAVGWAGLGDKLINIVFPLNNRS